jgi:hypothetical protein
MDNTSSNSGKAVWSKSLTVGPDVEIKVSTKGYIGIWSRGRYVCGMYATVLEAITNNINSPDVNSLATEAVGIFEAGKPARDAEKLKAKLEKEALSMLKKAEMFQQAGIDLAALLAKKQA